MKNVKAIVACLSLFAVILLAGCANKPNNEILKTESKWTGKWINASPGHNPEKEMVDYVTVEPSWGQAWHYAFEGGAGFTLWLGVILVLGAIAYIIVGGFDLIPKLIGNVPAIIFPAFIGIIMGGYLIYHNVDWTRWNNQKELLKSDYDKMMKEDGSIKKFWEQLEANQEILGGPHPK